MFFFKLHNNICILTKYKFKLSLNASNNLNFVIMLLISVKISIWRFLLIFIMDYLLIFYLIQHNFYNRYISNTRNIQIFILTKSYYHIMSTHRYDLISIYYIISILVFTRYFGNQILPNIFFFWYINYLLYIK